MYFVEVKLNNDVAVNLLFTGDGTLENDAFWVAYGSPVG